MEMLSPTSWKVQLRIESDRGSLSMVTLELSFYANHCKGTLKPDTM